MLISAQANVSGGPGCEKVLREGPTLPPYSKRAMLCDAGIGAYNLTKRAPCLVRNAHQTILAFGLAKTSALAAFLAFAVAWVILISLRSRSVGEEIFQCPGSRPSEEVVFTSPVRSEGTVKVTWHYPEGSETVEPDGPVQITRRRPREHQDIGEVRRRIIHQEISEEDNYPGLDGGLVGLSNLNTSGDTLVDAWTESNSKKVSIGISSDETPHDGLIELKHTGSTKNFLDPDTGASYHLSPWKSTHSDDEDDEPSLKAKPKVEGAVKRAIVKMGVGGGALASGKAIEDQIGDALQKKERIPQQAGDCLAGEVTNEAS